MDDKELAERRTLTEEVSTAFRLVITGAAAILALLAGAVAWLAVVSAPAVNQASAVVRSSDDLQRWLVGEQAAVRSYIQTRNAEWLNVYAADRGRETLEVTTMWSQGLTSAIETQLNRFESAVNDWTASWVSQVTNPVSRQLIISNPQGATAYLTSGDAAFAVAQNAQLSLVSAAEAHLTHSRRDSFVAVGVTASLLIAVAATVLISVVRRRQELQRRVVGPVRLLLEKVQAVGRGEFGPSPALEAPAELMELRNELVDMSGSLRLQQQALTSRADLAAQTALRLQFIVEFAKQVTSSLTLDHVLHAVTSASCRLLSSNRARVWLLDDGGKTLHLAHDSASSELSVVGLTQAVGGSGVGRAAREHRLCYSLGLTGDQYRKAGGVLALSLPLITGDDALVGVLEVALSADARQLRADTVDVLEAMGSHAATAIDAALLYAKVETLSLSDPLTGLANRRRFDQDIIVEVQRSLRTGRTMTVLMIDVDHFKRVNDTFGHSVGDRVLREIGESLSEHLRAGDEAYRFGGEEFAILARDTDLQGALVVAERTRKAIETRFGEGRGPRVTVSIGLGTLPDHARSADGVVAAADAALYAAKQQGRNRVSLFSGVMPEQRVSV